MCLVPERLELRRSVYCLDMAVKKSLKPVTADILQRMRKKWYGSSCNDAGMQVIVVSYVWLSVWMIAAT